MAMGIVGGLALLANLGVAFLLYRYRTGDSVVVRLAGGRTITVPSCSRPTATSGC